MIERWFLAHPRELGESWGEHARQAARFGWAMIGGGLACLAHAACPAIATRTGSRTIDRLHAAMVLNRRTMSPQVDADAHGHYFRDAGVGI